MDTRGTRRRGGHQNIRPLDVFNGSATEPIGSASVLPPESWGSAGPLPHQRTGSAKAGVQDLFVSRWIHLGATETGGKDVAATVRCW